MQDKHYKNGAANDGFRLGKPRKRTIILAGKRRRKYRLSQLINGTTGVSTTVSRDAASDHEFTAQVSMR